MENEEKFSVDTQNLKTETNIDNKVFTVIIIENQEKQVAFVVDKLLGDQEVFQKKLIPPILKIKNLFELSF